MLLGAMVCLAGGLLALGSSIRSLNKGRPSGQRPSSSSSSSHAHAKTTTKDAAGRHRRGRGKHATAISAPKPDGGADNVQCRGLVDLVDPCGEMVSNTSELETAPQLPPLLKVNGLFESRNPAIVDITTWVGSYVINIDKDGNCFGTSWLIAAILWAAQSPTRLEYVISVLEYASRPDQAFGCLDRTCTRYVDDLVAYLKSLTKDWIGHDASDTAHGAFLAVGVVQTFLGKNCPGYTIEHHVNEEALWLRLKWGVAIASRALDVWTSCRHGTDDASIKLRELRQDVDLDFSKLLEAGAKADTPGAGVLRPGGSLGLLTGLIVDRYLDGGRSHDDYTEFLTAATRASGSKTTTGLTVHQAGLPHFDVLVTPQVDDFFVGFLAYSFDLPEPVMDEAEAAHILQLRTESQRKTTAEELEVMVPEDELAEQIAAMKAFEDQQIENRKTYQAAREP